MTNPRRTSEDYELLIYSLPQQDRSIQCSTLAFVRLGVSLARVAGEVHFAQKYRLVVRQRIVFDRLPAIIDEYGYEVWRGSAKLYWYDSQPHPGDQALQATHPHHKHVPPDIKHYRLPAANMGFAFPNLPALIAEIEAMLEQEG